MRSSPSPYLGTSHSAPPLLPTPIHSPPLHPPLQCNVSVPLHPSTSMLQDEAAATAGARELLHCAVAMQCSQPPQGGAVLLTTLFMGRAINKHMHTQTDSGTCL